MFRKASAAVRFFLEWIAASHWRSFIIIFFLVFGIRAYELAHFPPKLVLPNTRMELISIARSIYVDGEFADAYLIRTGATAHLPPILPAIIALTYHIFGFNLTAGYAGFLFIILSTAAIYALLPWLAERYGFDRQAGVIGALAAAVNVIWSGHGEHLAALMLALLLVGMIGRWRKARASFRTSILLGLGWGIAFHIKPALLPIFVGCLGFELWWRKNRGNWTRTGVMVLAVMIACLPWALRNYVTFGEVFFIRSNLGLELRVGNNDLAEAAMEVMDRRPVFPRHPAVQVTEARLLQKIGEMEYMRQAQREALEWMQENPTEFLQLTALRFVYYWFGPLFQPITVTKIAYTLLSVAAILGLWRWRRDLDPPQLAAVLIPLTTFGLIYYIVTYMPRYRIPVDWIFYILAGAEIWYWLSRGAEKSYSSVIEPDSN
jgi:4-amino-4-deoxy-L-arabinose transferase-like glycosyltransferase